MIDEEKTGRRGTFWRELPILLGVAILVAVVVRVFVLQTFWIPSGSMEHTLNINDRVLVNKLVYDFRDPHRGEIVVFTAPSEWRLGQADADFIKRVIGVAGDHVVCCDAAQRLVVNGHPLDEPYLNRSPDGTPQPATPDVFDITVPVGRLWVLGDNRFNSGDSRDNWVRHNHDIQEATIAVDAVVGRAFVVFWPLNRITWLSVPDTFALVPDPPGG